MKSARLSWCLSSNPSLAVGFFIHDEARDVTRSAPQGAHYHADVVSKLHVQGEGREYNRYNTDIQPNLYIYYNAHLPICKRNFSNKITSGAPEREFVNIENPFPTGLT